MRTPKIVFLALILAVPAASDSPQGWDDVDAPVIHVQFQPTGQAAVQAQDRAEIPLTKRAMGSPGYNLGDLSVPCSFNTHSGKCLLDTGAGVDVLNAPKGAGWAAQLPLTGEKWDLSGGCDSAKVEAEGVMVQDFALDQTHLGPTDFERRPRGNDAGASYDGIVGVRTLSKAASFSLRLTHGAALILDQRGAAGSGSFTLTPGKQIILSLEVSGVVIPVLFDTGASGTVIDLDLADGSDGRFSVVQGSEQQYAACAAGAKKKMALVQTSGLRIGNTGFPSRAFPAYSFKDLRQNLGADVRMILGYDVISRLDWTFDWKSKTWSASSGITIQNAENVPPDFGGMGAAADSALSSLTYAR